MQGFPHVFEGDKSELSDAVAAFKNGLTPLPGVDKGEQRIKLAVQTKKKGEEVQAEDKIPYADQKVKVLWDGKPIASTELRSYRKYEVTLRQKAALRAPDVKIFVIRYWGDWTEVGYTIDQALFVPAATPAVKQKATLFVLQLLSVKDEAAAVSEQKKLEAKGVPSFIEKASKDGQTLYRLKSGVFLLKGQAEAEKAKIKKLSGHEAILLTVASPT